MSFKVMPIKMDMETMMSDMSEYEVLNTKWLTAWLALEAAQKEIHEQMESYLQGAGDPPSRKMMEAVDDLTFEMHEARGELDEFISQFAS